MATNRFDRLDNLKEVFCGKDLLDEIVQTMSDHEFEEVANWIDRMQDINSKN